MSVRSFVIAGFAGVLVAAPVTPALAQHNHDHAGHSHSAHAHGHAKPAKKPPRKASPAHARKPTPTKAASPQSHAHDHAADAGSVHRHAGGVHDHGVETENMFGFVLGSDVEPAGARSIAMETIGRFGKRGGAYSALGSKIEFAYGVTDNLSVAGAVLGGYHNVSGVPGFTDVTRLRLNGLGGEVRWRLVSREAQGIGLTLHAEPVWAVSDELTGMPARKWGAENKIILDTMLSPEKVYAAFNVIHEMEVVKEKGALETERASKIGAGVAVTAAVTKNIFVGAEARYLHAYDGLDFAAFAGRALYIGPTAFAKFDNGLWASLAWNVQVAGNEKGLFGKYDLTNFERHTVRLKVGYDF